MLRKLQANLAALGARRVAALALSGLTVFILVGVSGYLLSRPQQEVLYAGLDPEDVTRIGAVLGEAGIAFDVSVSGDSVMVTYGQAAKARMTLAQKGLPRSDTAGYELFDKLGSLGLTTFMQQVTKVRALEGELARTIQQIDGIKAARVHLAMRSEASFRSLGEKPTASVVIRADRGTAEQSAQAVRYLVAAAIPGLVPDQVTVMSAEGILLASSDDTVAAAPEKLIGLEREVATAVETRIAKTIAPYLGTGNYTVSVSARLNADRRQISETAFDPNSRVERSVRTIKESGEAENATGAEAVTVEQNIPVEETPKASGDNSRERKDRKEELTNYEINSKSVTTTSEGYAIERLSIAIVVNRSQIGRMLGEGATTEAIDEKVKELERLAASAAGIVAERGDAIVISAIDFLPEDDALIAIEGEGVFDSLLGHAGSLVNAGALIIVSLLVILLGLRPAVRAILNEPTLLPAAEDTAMLPGLQQATDANGYPLSGEAVGQSPRQALEAPDPLLESLARGARNDPKERLAKIVEIDPDRAVQVLKQWLGEATGEAA